MEKTREEMEKEIEFLDQSLKTAKGSVVCLTDRVNNLEKEIKFYITIIKYLIRY